MNFLRPLCSISALAYCVCLGIFALAHKNRTPLHVHFAFYNFANALYNMADYVFLFHSYNSALLWNRLTGIGGCMMMPFVMRFVFELIEEQTDHFKRVGNFLFYLGIVFSIFYLTTPYFIKALTQDYRVKMINLEIAGPLYPLFILYVLSGLVIIIYRVAVRYRRTKSSMLQQKMRYVVLALSIGTLALCTYFLSFVWLDLPEVYYTLQALVAFTFSYAIFKHDLLPVNLAVRRFLLVGGIYLLIGVLIMPIFLFSYRYVLVSHSAPLLFSLILCSGFIFSMGPFLYAQMVRRSAIFQNNEALHLTHEFKTPLSAIQNAQQILDLELAQPSPDPSKVHDYMTMIQRNTQRLERFVIDILNVGKAGESSREIHKQHVNLRVLLQNIVAHFPNTMNHIQIVDNATAIAEIILGDQEALQQIFTNLIANAVASGPQASVEISIQQKQNEVEVIVRDNGQGILTEDLERIFQPFARSKHASHSKSTGLGLAIAERWVRAHNGHIWAESDGAGTGAAFHVVLPIN